MKKLSDFDKLWYVVECLIGLVLIGVGTNSIIVPIGLLLFGRFLVIRSKYD